MQAIYDGRIEAVEKNVAALSARVDSLMLMMVGTLATSLATFVAVVLAYVLGHRA